MKAIRKLKPISILLSIAVGILAFCCVTVLTPDSANSETYYAAANILSGLTVDEKSPLGIIPELDKSCGTHNSEYEYKLDKVLKVSYGNVYKFRQTHNGADLPAGDLVVCTDEQNHVLSFFGEAVEPDNTYTVNAASVLQGVTVSMPQTDALGNTVYLPVDNYAENAYGLYDLTRNIFVVNMTDDNKPEYYYNTTGVFEPIAVSAYANVIKAYDFYTDKNNIGVSLYGVDGGNDDIAENYVEKNEVVVMVYVHYGDEYENANCGYYDEYRRADMLVGDGKADGKIYMPGNASDVIGHEYQHAVSGYVAGFEYFNDSGALNEAFSDIFGALIEGHEIYSDEFWMIGENCATGDKADLRSIKGGTTDYKYDIADKIPNCELDHDHAECRYGGTHQNSTIISHIQYELCQKLPEFFTRERIGELWYSTLCTLTPKSNFNDFGLRFYRTAQNLGYGQKECGAIFDSLNARGILPVYKVEFLNDDGSTISEYTAVRGDSISYPQDPTRLSDEMYDYLFDCWSEHEDTVTSDVTIYAEYIRSNRLYDVKFVGTNGEVLFSRRSKHGDSVIPLSLKIEYDRENYDFDGWYIDAALTEPLSPDALVAGDITLYGKFTKIEKPNVLIIALSVSLSVAVIVGIAVFILVKKFKRGKGKSVE